MRQGVFGHGKHLQDVAAERALDVVEVDFGKVLAHDLFGRVVDEDVDDAEGRDMLLHGLFARVVVHQIPGDQQALGAFLLHHLLRVFGIYLLLGEVDNADVGALARKEDGDGPPDAGAGNNVGASETKGLLSTSNQRLAPLELASCRVLVGLALALQLCGLARWLHVSLKAAGKR